MHTPIIETPDPVGTQKRSERPEQSVRAWSFLRGLEQSGLLDGGAVAKLRKKHGDNIASLTAELLDSGALTEYQIRQLRAGDPSMLKFGPYQILDELGRGGFGVVYLARHSVMDRKVALKVIAPESIEDQSSRELFLREVVATTRLEHPNIATAYDAGEVDGKLYFAMEFVGGRTLQDHILDQDRKSVV